MDEGYIKFSCNWIPFSFGKDLDEAGSILIDKL